MKDDTLADVHPERLPLKAQDNSATLLPFKPRVSAETEAKAVANAAIVEMLERHLAEAKEGKITFLAHAMLDHNGIAFSTWEPANGGPAHVTRAMGSVAFLAHRFNEACLEGAVSYEEIPI